MVVVPLNVGRQEVNLFYLTIIPGQQSQLVEF
jgi:hypothetical protein